MLRRSQDVPDVKDTGPSQNSVCAFQLFYHYMSLLQAYVLVSFFLFAYFSLIPPKTYISLYLDGEKISKISLFVLAQLTNVTDRQTDGHRMPTYTALMRMHRAVKIKAVFQQIDVEWMEILPAPTGNSNTNSTETSSATSTPKLGPQTLIDVSFP